MTAEEFSRLGFGDVILEFDSMRHWTVIGVIGKGVAIQTTRILNNPSQIELEGWAKTERVIADRPPF